RYGGAASDAVATPAWDEPFQDAGHVLRLLPAGHILGSAMLHVTRLADGASLLYTGDFKLRQGLSAEAAVLREADTLVMETTFGLPEFRFPPTEKIVADLRAFVRETIEDGEIPVLLGYSLGKAQEILAALDGLGVPVMLHRSIVKLTEVYERVRQPFTEWKPFQAETAAGHILILPPSAARSQALRRMKRTRTAMLTGWAMTPGATYRYQVDEVFPLSDHADYGELLECVERVKPSLVYTVHGYTAEFARDLRARGYEAWSLVGDNQLELALDVAPPPADIVSEEPATATDGERAELPVDSFALWAATCEAVAAESSRLRKQERLADYLRRLPEDELARAARWFSGSLEDPALQVAPVQTGWATIRQSLMAVSGLREAEYRRLSRSQNDTGRTAYLALQRKPASPDAGRSGTLADVAALFARLREAQGPAAKSAVLRAALASLPPLEGSYVVRLLTGELRMGSREGLVEEAVAAAFAQRADEVREAAMRCGDIGRAAVLAGKGRLVEAQPSLHVPVKAMLASPEESAEAIWTRLAIERQQSGVWLEDKYDGIRAQLHVGGGRAEIYTRDLKSVSEQFPEIATAAAELSDEIIADGEIIAHADDKRLGFHDLQRRLGRKGEADLFIRSDISVQYVVFDLLWLNGRSLLHEPLEIRRRHLESLVLPVGWQRIAIRDATSPEAIEEAFHAARRAGNEGLIAKDRRSPYSPGRRGKSWLKLKKAFSTLDVVVVKAEQGHGKRSHVLSDYTFAVRDEADALRVIGKAYSGLTDAEIEELTEHFAEHTLSQRGNVRTVVPDIVLEIAFDSIRPSQRHDSGLALRFPRIKAIRRDKTAADIDTLAYARALAGVGGVDS
ncbi:MAG TPA: ATP-dependent DNA ligase, partial [Bacteroidia bacterium]|nr:ATP-dependent DNA ligase [Bacteroidia bacterium]